MKKKIILPVIISVLAGLLVILLYIAGLLDGLELKSYDFRFKLRGAIPVSRNIELLEKQEGRDPQFFDNIVIVAVDEDSVSEFGRWPWSRNYHARLIDTLMRVGARVVVFDIIFSERDRNLPLFDLELSSITEKYTDRVVYANFIEYAVTPVVEGDRIVQKMSSSVLNPYPDLNLAAKHKGFANADPDEDGVLRRSILQLEVSGIRHHSLDLAAAALFTGSTSEDIINKMPSKYRNAFSVNYRGGNNTFKSYSFKQVIDEKIPDIPFKTNWFKDKIVLVGSTTTGTFDHYPVPFSKHFPGVEFHANVIDNLLEGDFIKQNSPILTVLLVIFFALLSAFFLALMRGITGSYLVLAALIAYSGLTVLLFNKFNVAIEFVAPVLAIVLSYIGVLFYRFISEEKEKRWIKKSFGSYVSPAVIEQIVSDPSKLRLGGERKTLTVMFSDIRSFTTMSEGMSPENVVDILNEYLTKMTEIVFSTGGTLDKFIGDAVMAFWGAPVEQPDHVKRAVKAAIMMFSELKKLHQKWTAEGKPLINIGVGINTGEMVVGNMGSVERMDYTVIGDNVNLASRLEGLNKQFSCHIIISESTYEVVKDLVKTEHLGNVKVKGKEKEVSIYRVDENSSVDKL